MTVKTPFARRAAAPLVALLIVAGCSTGPSGTDVTRFHLGGPIAKGTIMLEGGTPAQTAGLEFQTYAAQVAEGLRAAGFAPIGTLLPAEYVGTVSFGQSAQVLPSSGSAVSVGFGVGGGSFGRGGGGGVGVGTGVTTPVGGGGKVVNVNTLGLQIKRRSDQTMIWEGKAVTAAPAGTGLATAMPGLVSALLRDFPGPASQTVNYKQ